jgi:hypothetical protein
VRGWPLNSASADPPDGAKVDVLRAVRGYLGAAREHLAGGASPAHRSRVNGLHADLMDRLVRRLYRIAENESFAEEGVAPSRAALLAVGATRGARCRSTRRRPLLLHEGAVTPT